MKSIKAIIALAIVLSLAGIVQALPVTINEVEIDDTVIQPNAVNRLDLERGEEYDVRVKLTPIANIDNVEVRVFISGYEYNDVEEISDKTTVFDADANVTYVKKFTIKIPDEVDEDDYKLRVIVSDRFNDELLQSYNLKIDVPRNALAIEDVVLSPSNAVKAGSALLATVRVENKGEKSQDDVKVTVSIPALGISGTEYIEEIDNDDEEEETEEIFLRIPRCTKAGSYDVNVDVEYSQNHRKVSQKKTISVLADETCDDEQPKTTITLGNQMQNVMGGQTAVFPITVTNAGRTSKTFVVTVPSSDWATVTMTPTSTLVVPAGTTQTIFVNVAVGEDTPSGAHSLTATVTSGTQTVQELTLTSNVTKQTSGLKGVFEVVLIVLVVLLVIIGIVIGIGHYRNRDQAETYY